MSDFGNFSFNSRLDIDKIKHFKKPALIGIGIAILFIWIAAIIVLSVYFDGVTFKDDYAIVFDAGSTGTKMNIYSWKGRPAATSNAPVAIQPYLSCLNNDNGIDKFTSRGDVILSFNDCMQQASKSIPVERKRRTFITLSGTAGMRLLNLTNPTQASAVLGLIRDYFNASEFVFASPDQVQILDGKTEGLFSWIGTNYMQKIFSQTSQPSDTVGLLDLGDISMQMVFQPLVNFTFNTSVNDYFASARIYGVDYAPYSYSYSCWGRNQIYSIFQTYLIMKGNFSTNVTNPCLAQGSSSSMPGSTITSSSCIASFNFPLGFNQSSIMANATYTLTGSSDPTGCRRELNALFSDQGCMFPPCSFNGVYLPSVNSVQFYAYSGFSTQINDTETLLQRSFRKNMQAFRNASDFLCSGTTSQLSTMNRLVNNSLASSNLQILCFANNYMNILFDKFGITSFDNVQFDTNGSNLGWTLGSVVTQASRSDYLPFEGPTRTLPAEFFIPAIIIASVFTMLTIIAILVCIFWY